MSSIIRYPASFNGTAFDSVPGVSVLMIDAYKPGKRKLNLGNIAQQSRSRVSMALMDAKPITVRLGINRATRDLCEVSLDAIMAIVQPKEKYLVIEQSGTTRQYKCTFTTPVVNYGGGSYMEVDLLFECSDKYGVSTASTLLAAFSGYNSSYRTDNVTIGGSLLDQPIVYTLTIGAVTGGTSATVNIGNDETGQEIHVTRTWVPGDVLVVDVDAESVTVNGVEVDFTGALPTFVPGTPRYITYSDNFTTRTVSGSITQTPRWA